MWLHDFEVGFINYLAECFLSTRRKIVRNIFKRWAGWIIGVLVASYGFSLWRGENVDWENVITLSVGGAIGMLVVEGVRNIMKKDSEDNV